VNAFVKNLWRLGLILLALALAVPPARSQPGEAPAVPPVPTPTNATNEAAEQLLRAFLLLQEQLRNTQKAVEQAREQSKEDAKRYEELVAARLNVLEQTVNNQRTQEIEAIQQSSRTVFVLASIVTAAGLIAVIFAGLVQVRAMTRLSEVSQQLRTAVPWTALGLSPHTLVGGREAIENGSTNLLTMVERLQKRMEEMEAAAAATQTATNGHKQIPASATINPQVTTLLGKGQALLNLDKAEEALDQFDEALRLEPKNIEAWIKKGTALERLQRVDEAIVAYDQAIAVDGSTATAYLFKAGVYNRQKKYAEALQCYEKALSAQQKSRTQPARVASS
jgi:tetratricopeptide (TPR) repeat protein